MFCFIKKINNLVNLDFTEKSAQNVAIFKILMPFPSDLFFSKCIHRVGKHRRVTEIAKILNYMRMTNII